LYIKEKYENEYHGRVWIRIIQHTNMINTDGWLLWI